MIYGCHAPLSPMSSRLPHLLYWNRSRFPQTSVFHTDIGLRCVRHVHNTRSEFFIELSFNPPPPELSPCPTQGLQNHGETAVSLPVSHNFVQNLKFEKNKNMKKCYKRLNIFLIIFIYLIFNFLVFKKKSIAFCKNNNFSAVGHQNLFFQIWKYMKFSENGFSTTKGGFSV